MSLCYLRMWNIRKLFILLAAFLIFFSHFALAGSISKKVCLNGTCVKAEIMENEEGRQKGLMFRQGLADASGMLFVFDQEGVYSFWMKNMRFALDIVWISEDKKVSSIVCNALPCASDCQSLTPNANAKYVLEVNSGFVKKNNIKIGDRADF
jgi:uncharacterized protein